MFLELLLKVRTKFYLDGSYGKPRLTCGFFLQFLRCCWC